MIREGRRDDSPAPLSIAVVMYDRMTALDAVGPLEVLRFIPGVRVTVVARRPGVVRTDNPALELVATASFADVTEPDVVVVPGGPGTSDVLDGELVDWLRRVHEGVRWITSVCSGSLILGSAGLLQGVMATSHFAVLDLLSTFGAMPTSRRVVVDRESRVITSAGVSAGIDMALMLTAELTDELTARAIQLLVEYDPRPPFDGGSLASASRAVIDRAVTIGKVHGAIPPFYRPPLDAPT